MSKQHMSRPDLPRRSRLSLAIQREAGRLLAVVWVPTAAFFLRVMMRYRIPDAARIRKRYRQLIKGMDRPVLICANHLTMVDSAVLAWALGGSWWYVLNYKRMPWNLPESTNFAFNWLNRAAAWIAKCIPVTRGGDRRRTSHVLQRIQHLLSRGDTALIFPEGGRSRSGRVDLEAVADGVGRILSSVKECATLCVYLRGERQKTWSALPARGDSFYVDFELFQPQSQFRGLRR